MSKRGFASMDSAKQKEIASMGGKKAHANGRAHKYTTEEARAAGKLGGKASQMARKQRVEEEILAKEEADLLAKMADAQLAKMAESDVLGPVETAGEHVGA